MSKAKFFDVLRKAFKYILPPAISVGLCYVLFTGVNFSEMMDKINDPGNNLWWIALALLLSGFSNIIRALRWRIQLLALNINAPLKAVVNSIFGTYAVNLVLPRLGEIWRTGYIAQRQDAPFSVVFGSMIAERMADTVTVLLLTVATFFLAGNEIVAFMQEYPQFYNLVISIISSPWLWIGIAGFIAILWLIFTRCPNNIIVVKVKGLVAGLWQGFATVATMKGKVKWVILTFALWGCYFVQLYVAFFAFAETAQVIGSHGIIAALVCFVLSSIAMGIPSNGGIGPWQIAVMFGLSMYGVSQVPALAFANLVLGTQTILIILLGLYAFVAITLERRSRQ